MAIPIQIVRATPTAEFLIYTVKPDSSSNIQKKLLGDDVASLSFELNAMYNFNIGDFAVILGETYYISKPPIVVKKSKYNYVYSLIMESQQYKLRNAQYLFYNAVNNLGEADFSLTGTADDFMNLLILNANRIGEHWVKGGVIITGYKTLTFSKEDCLSVLSKIANEFETEFYIEGNMVHLAKRQQLTTYTFMYGRHLGLYTIGRELADDVVITRLYVYGSGSNLPNNYRNFSPRLLINSTDKCLISDLSVTIVDNSPAPTQTYTFTYTLPTGAGITNLQIEWRDFGTSDVWQTDLGLMESPRAITIATADYEFRFRTIGGGVCDTKITDVVHIFETTTQLLLQRPSVIEKNVNIYGVIEGTLIVEDIFPQREGVVTAADVSNFYKFKDVAIDFNVNDQLLPGLAAKVVFQTGQLAGYKFDVSSFNNATKEFTILKNKDEKALDLPSAFFRPVIGDKYILLDILMPQTYVTAAEIALRAKAVEYLDLKSVPAYKYSIDCDPAYFRSQNISLKVGDVVQIIDNELQINKPIRILSITRSLIDEFEYSVELGDTLSQGTIAALQNSTTINNSNINNTAAAFNNNAMLNGTYIGNFKIEQGTLNLKDVGTAGSTAAMKKLWIDADGNVWKES